MDLRFSPEDEQYRQTLRTWLEANRPQESPPKDQDAEFAYRRVWQRKLYEDGWVGINWPKEYGGQGATLIQQAIYAKRWPGRGPHSRPTDSASALSDPR